jgi:hypothetical protein
MTNQPRNGRCLPALAASLRETGFPTVERPTQWVRRLDAGYPAGVRMKRTGDKIPERTCRAGATRNAYQLPFSGSFRMPVKQPSRKAKSGDVFGRPRRRAKMLRDALCARVSTNDRQTLAMQGCAPREYVARRGWTIALQIRDAGSGAVERKAREQLIKAARRREIDRDGAHNRRPGSD